MMRRRPIFAWVGLAALLIAIAGCNSKPLPELDSYAGQLYVKRCGGCHPPYNPHALTPAMWAVRVDAMEPKITQAGMAPLSAEERRVILDYLTRNAGEQ
ncbi:MAG: hypothetical protein WA005_06370 [Candidatus Binataceae bacterium]